LRAFSAEHCRALDFFVADGGKAVSCANESYLRAASFGELVERLEAICFWHRSNVVLCHDETLAAGVSGAKKSPRSRRQCFHGTAEREFPLLLTLAREPETRAAKTLCVLTVGISFRVKSRCPKLLEVNERERKRKRVWSCLGLSNRRIHAPGSYVNDCADSARKCSADGPLQ
jgi:hypothetical protein